MARMSRGEDDSSPMSYDDSNMASSGFVHSDIPPQRLRNNEAALFVGGLSFSATEEDLRRAFGGIGPIVSVRIVQDRETGKPRGFAFVNFETPECVDAAIQECQGMDLCGRNVRLDRSAAGIMGRGNGMGSSSARIGGRPSFNAGNVGGAGGYYMSPGSNNTVGQSQPNFFAPAGLVGGAPPEYFMYPSHGVPMGHHHPMMAAAHHGPFFGNSAPFPPGPPGGHYIYQATSVENSSAPIGSLGGMMPPHPSQYGMVSGNPHSNTAASYLPVGGMHHHVNGGMMPPPPAAPTDDSSSAMLSSQSVSGQ